MRADRMNINPIETDYLIVGAGAAGMAFADTILTETDARILVVDRRPGENEKVALLQRYRGAVMPAMAKLPQLLATWPDVSRPL
jgi:NADH dehydrogenase FAD-containing subunit